MEGWDTGSSYTQSDGSDFELADKGVGNDRGPSDVSATVPSSENDRDGGPLEISRSVEDPNHAPTDDSTTPTADKSNMDGPPAHNAKKPPARSTKKPARSTRKPPARSTKKPARSTRKPPARSAKKPAPSTKKPPARNAKKPAPSTKMPPAHSAKKPPTSNVPCTTSTESTPHSSEMVSATNSTTTSGYVSKDISMTDEQKQPSKIVPYNKINSNDDHSKLLQSVAECTEEGSESEPYILPVATRDTPQVAEETSIPPSSEMVCLVQPSIPVDDGEDDKDTETIKWAVPVEANNRNHRNPRKPPDLSSYGSFETPKQENEGFLDLSNHQVRPYTYSYVDIPSRPPDTKTCLLPVYKFESVNVESPDPVELVRFEE